MNLLIFGAGFSAGFFAQAYRERFGQIAATHRQSGALPFDGAPPSRALCQAIAQADALLISIPPQGDEDIVLKACCDDIATAKHLRQIVYLSTIGVYGDHAGGWIDEATPVNPGSDRTQARVEIEQQWRRLAQSRGKNTALTILRLAGIYGPGRSAIETLRAGAARRIDKPGQVFNRIHVADIAQAIAAAFERDGSGVYNVTDDEPAPPQEVMAFAARLMGLEPPPLIPLEQAALSPMGRSFYSANRRVSNQKLRHALGVDLLYPTYREGLSAIWQAQGQN